MGRTVPTFVQLIEGAAARWSKFRRALRREDQEHFDRLFRSVRSYTQAATYQCHDNPMEARFYCPSRSIWKSVSGPSNIPEKTSMRLDGWILDIYPCRQGMTLWLLTPQQTRHRLIDAFSPAFYAHGPEPQLQRLAQAIARRNRAPPAVFTERINLWENRAITVLEVSVKDPTQLRSQTYWVHQFDAALPLFNTDLMLASVYCWQKRKSISIGPCGSGSG